MHKAIPLRVRAPALVERPPPLLPPRAPFARRRPFFFPPPPNPHKVEKMAGPGHGLALARGVCAVLAVGVTLLLADLRNLYRILCHRVEPERGRYVPI